ncbi:hypothetical protein LWC35_12985 [Pseudonocardia kujensis]|uniref:hypothetical protein n=1 Tax=Pseudonocardia kujensis TaxID=1128675 RepID=UPI001E5BE576|nr:hypothetical protein [Pseudonocardia kujensis]MCE0763816.1 hypothetical protein [Pseudonocardia kujensis]
MLTGEVAHAAAPLTDEAAEQLAARDAAVVHGRVESLEVVDDRLVAVRLADGRSVPRGPRTRHAEGGAGSDQRVAALVAGDRRHGL